MIRTLNDHIIGSVNIELDFGSGIRVTQTKLRHFLLCWLKGLDKMRHVDANTTANLLNNLTTTDLTANFLLDSLKEFWIENADCLSLGQIRAQECLHVIELIDIIRILTID